MPIYKRKSGLQAEVTHDGTVVYDQARSSIIFLNETASAVLELCDGRADAAQIANSLMISYLLARAPLRDVKNCLAALAKQGLLDECANETQKR